MELIPALSGIEEFWVSYLELGRRSSIPMSLGIIYKGEKLEGNKNTKLEYYSFEATFSRMLESSNFTSGMIALLLVLTLAYCVVNNLVIPESLSYAVASVIGYFFGAKKAVQRRLDDQAFSSAVNYCPNARPPAYKEKSQGN